jgi:hypothetical protein
MKIFSLRTSSAKNPCAKNTRRIFESYSTQLCAVRIEMENYFPHTNHGLSMDRTSIGTGPIITRVESNQSPLYC